MAAAYHDARVMTIAVITLSVVSVIALVLAFRGSDSRNVAAPPSPPAPVTAGTTSGTPASTAAASASRSSSSPAAKPARCSRPRTSGGGATPVRICIPALRVDATMMTLGLNDDHTVQVPPLSRVRDAGWYKYSAKPGAVGPTVILGHVDSAQYGDGVFFRLGLLHAGDQLVVTRGDGKIATFRVDSVSEIAKSRFPTQAVYGATSGPAIRLVTCGGHFDAATRNYLDNIIVYGTLLSLRPA